MTNTDWNPSNTHVVILGLGLDDWAEPDNPSWKRHRTLAQMFERAGVPEGQVHLWEDATGTAASIKRRLPRILENMEEDGLFVFYYAGHGDVDPDEDDEFYFCHPTDESDWLYGSELIDMIDEHLNGERAVLFLDCCFSGWIARAVADYDTDGAYAAITSSTRDVESTGNWTFTDCLLAALRGERGIDANADGSISFAELARHVTHRMRTVDSQPADYAHTSAFDPSFRLALARR
ncbi:MAG: caspase family protein [Deltaproteobacteria bacterium]|nr:caspase family protein [Deltaproteobacteria bacterium]